MLSSKNKGPPFHVEYLSALKSIFVLSKNYQGSWFLLPMNSSACNSACREMASNILHSCGLLESLPLAEAFSAAASSLSSDLERSRAYRTSVGKTLTCDQLASSLFFQLGGDTLRDCVLQLQSRSQAEAEVESWSLWSPGRLPTSAWLW